MEGGELAREVAVHLLSNLREDAGKEVRARLIALEMLLLSGSKRRLPAVTS